MLAFCGFEPTEIFDPSVYIRAQLPLTYIAFSQSFAGVRSAQH